MVKPTSVDDIIAEFPTKILPPIPGKPDYDCISKLNQLMYGNAATLPTTLGGSAHSHVGLIMNETLYVTLSSTAYVAPAEPPLTPFIPPTTKMRHFNNSVINIRKNYEYTKTTSTWMMQSRPNFYMQLKIRM